MLRVCSGCILLFLVANFVEGKDEIPANLIAGKQVDANAKLQVGTKLVAVFEKKNYLVEIREIKSDKKLKILWIESKEETDDVAPNELYFIGDSTQTRKSRTAALPEAYRAFDKNGDGQIGLYEWDRAKYAEFKKLDKNHDRFLTPQELTAKGATPTVSTASSTPAAPAKEGESKDKPTPVNLAEYKDKVDQTFTFTVTGRATGGGVWGTDKYSTDSNLAAAAVHAGALKDGATGQVVITITAPVDKFTTSTANGVTSVERNEKGPAFTIKAAP